VLLFYIKKRVKLHIQILKGVLKSLLKIEKRETRMRNYKKYRYLAIGLIATLLISILLKLLLKEEDTIYIDIDKNQTKNSCSAEKINRLLHQISKSNQYTTLYLRGEGVCEISEPITIPNNTKLLGDPLVSLKLKDNLDWERYKPVIGQYGIEEWKRFKEINNSIENVEIGGFSIDVGRQKKPNREGYFPIILFYNPIHIKIHNLILKNSKWDAIRFETTTTRRAIYSQIYKNKIFDAGNNGIYIINSTDFKIYKNEIISTQLNCGIKISECDRFLIYKNIIGNSLGKRASGYAGILIENKKSSIREANISNNLIYGKNLGIVLDGYDQNSSRKKSGVHIYKNIIYRPRHLLIKGKKIGGGIRINDFNNTLIEKNIIEKSLFDGIIYEGKVKSENIYQTTLKDNIIIDNNRFGINNSKNSKNSHKFILKDNILYGNKKNYSNTPSSINDIYIKPNFIKPHTIQNSWHHIAITYNSIEHILSVYIDGKERLKEKNIDLDGVFKNKKALFIGGYKGIGYWFDGKVAITLLNRELNSTQIKQLYNTKTKKRNSYEEITEVVDLKPTLFNRGYRYIKYPSHLDIETDFTISSWIYNMSNRQEEYQTLLNKGVRGNRKYIWIYTKADELFIKFKNRGVAKTIDIPILDFSEIFKIKENRKEE